MKNEIRKYYQQIRKSLSTEEIMQKSFMITDRLLQLALWKEARCICCYLSLPKEVATDDLFSYGWQQGKHMSIPISIPATKQIKLSFLENFHHLEKSPLGIRELPEVFYQSCDPKTVELCIIPGIAFDRCGNRLGFGAGYYDRFLPKLSPQAVKIALAFSEQIHPEALPYDVYDIPMDYIITEKEIISILPKP